MTIYTKSVCSFTQKKEDIHRIYHHILFVLLKKILCFSLHTNLVFSLYTVEYEDDAIQKEKKGISSILLHSNHQAEQ